MNAEDGPRSHRENETGLRAHDATLSGEDVIALARDLRRLSAVIDATPAHVYAMDAEGRYLLGNRAYRELLGVSEQELLSQSFFDRFPEDEARRFQAHNEKVLRLGRALEFEERAVIGGEERIFRSIKAPLPAEDGRVAGVVGISTDITHWRRTEESLRESTARLQLALDVGEIGTLTLDLNTDMATMDPRAQAIFGFASPRYSRAQWLALVHPEDRERVDLETKAARDPAGEGIVESTYRILRDGQVRWIHRRSAVLFEGEDEERRATRVVVILQDITERKRFEIAQHEFLAMASHELRSPLAALKGNAQLLRRRGEYNERIAQTLVEQSDHLDRLVRDLMDITMATSGHFRLRPSLVDLVQVVEEEMHQQQQQATPAHVLELRSSPDHLEGIWDADRLRQILRNLLSNAVKYSPNGGRVSVDIEPLGDEVAVSVQDEGIGIPSTEQEQIFQRFYRLDSLSGRVDGLGLGLDVTRALVEAHGGRIAVTSAVGKGSTFRFTLPTRTLEVAELHTGASPPEGAGSVDATDTTARVLIVDDDRVVQRLLHELLEEEGYEVGIADDGRQALAVLSRRPYDILLVDLMMPNLDGAGLLAELERLGRRDALRVVVVSASHDAASRARAIGADAVVEKPFELDALLSKVRALLKTAHPR